MIARQPITHIRRQQEDLLTGALQEVLRHPLIEFAKSVQTDPSTRHAARRPSSGHRSVRDACSNGPGHGSSKRTARPRLPEATEGVRGVPLLLSPQTQRSRKTRSAAQVRVDVVTAVRVDEMIGPDETERPTPGAGRLMLGHAIRSPGGRRSIAGRPWPCAACGCGARQRAPAAALI